jgi:hypothetical protein
MYAGGLVFPVVQAAACLCGRMKSALYLVYRSVYPLPPLPRLLAAERQIFQIEVFRSPPYAGSQSNRPTPAVSVRGITKVVQVLPLTLGFQASFLATISPLRISGGVL